MPANGMRGRKGQKDDKQGKTRDQARRGGQKKIAEVTEEVLEVERADFISQKQTQLENVVDRHDTLVREMFHLDHFINMVGYDPKEAKTDNSKVFQNYKSTLFNLGDNLVAGPSRPTRRTRTQHAQPPMAPSISAPPLVSVSAPIPAQKHLTIRTNAEPPEREEPPGKQRKRRAAEVSPESIKVGIFDAEAPMAEESISAIYIHRKPVETPNKVFATASAAVKKRKLVENGASDEPVSAKSRRSGRLKGPPDELTHVDANEESIQSKDIVPLPLSRRRKAKESVPAIFTSPIKSNVKRIKLLVRRPPPPITNPKQRPPSTQYNSSVATFLNSYFTLHGQDVEEGILEQHIRADASILERAERLRNHSGFLPVLDESLKANAESLGTSLAPVRQSKDHWDYVVDTVCHVANLWRKGSFGRHITGQWAKAVRGYWDGQELMKEKLKAQEERRLRALAKATIRMVTDEWKKAVFYIREQERLKQEAEEVRRGREHLDAILDQSGQLLETQQGDLTRGENPRSRSSSMSLNHGWGSDEEDDDEDGDDGDEEGEEGEEDEEGEANEEETLDEAREEELNKEQETYDFEEAPSQLDDVDDFETDGVATQTLLSKTSPASASPSTLPSLAETGTIESPCDDDLSDHELHADRSSIAAVDDLVTAGPLSSPQRPRHSPSPLVSVPSTLGEAPLPILDLSITTSLSCHSPSTSAATNSLDQSVPKQEGLRDSENLYSSPISKHVEGMPVSPSVDSEKHLPEDDLTTELLGIVLDSYPNGSDPPVNSPITSPQTPSPDNKECNGGSQVTVKPTFGLTTDGHDSGQASADEVTSESEDDETVIPGYLKPFAVAPVEWNPDTKIIPPLLLRGNLRPYQQSGLEWLASLHTNNLNGILADEMGLGSVVPTSVLLNWEMEFKKFLPGFKVLSYHGSQKRRKELRQGWNDRHHFNVCITSYTLASRDAHIFKRKAWYYLILDEAHMIKNFKSQRWNILLMFRSFRRLLLTGTPLQNNLTELWALLQFLMSGSNFATLKDFGEWFSNPVEKAIEMGNADDDDTMQRVTKLHTVLRPYLLRRLKRDVEKELPSKYEHLVMCPLSKRQRFLYDEFMARAHTREALQSGVYQKIANILMQLRKVCNHPDLFEVRPIVTSFVMERSAIADFEIKELLVRRRLLQDPEDTLNFRLLGLRFIDDQGRSLVTVEETRLLDATSLLPFSSDSPGEAPPKDFRTIAGFRKYSSYLQRASTIARWSHIGYINRLRCNKEPPTYSAEKLTAAAKFYEPILPASFFDGRCPNWESIRVVNSMVKSYITRADESATVVEKFAFVTSTVVALELPRITLSGCGATVAEQPAAFDELLHKASVKLQIAFPDASLLQYDCGKLQELASLLREKKAGGHRVLIFTQMTKILDILEIFLNFHGYLYLRLDGATKIEDRQYITERFNADPRIFCFIASSRSGGVGINLTGADTVVFYDSDFNPQMDRQCEDRAHRIGQIRDVHIYRFVSQHTVEEALLRKANQKRSLDDLVIQKGEFDWRSLFNDQSALSKALEEFEDTEDVHAAAVAATEEVVMQGADEADFGGEPGETLVSTEAQETLGAPPQTTGEVTPQNELEPEDDVEEGGTIVDFMVTFVQEDFEFFKDWRI
ncbi:hypothetical protein H0H87_004816 [Tephrocybe sp. NHM501043]|nr:hypothetical protein H0H87_004816 [Tephrocybe sp. NHM501043]